MIVSLSHHFEQGHCNEEFYQDLPYFNDEQIEMLLDFLDCVEQDLPLVGKNKTSWQDNQGVEIPNTEAYKAGKFWHYHSGPYQSEIPNCYTYHLAWNIDGLTSSAVIHYQKLSEDEIYIVAYSPKHIPFPKSFDPHNPLVPRLIGNE